MFLVLTRAFVFDISLRSFATEWRQAQEEKEKQQRRNLINERAVLIKNGKMTPKLRSVLASIFMQYSSPPAGAGASSSASQAETLPVSYLKYTEAARLWYRCGLKLASLRTLLNDRPENAKNVFLTDFFGVIDRIVDEDEREFGRSIVDRPDPSLQVSDVRRARVKRLLLGHQYYL